MMLIIGIVATSCKDDPKFVVSGDMIDGKDVTLHLSLHFPDRIVDEVIATRSGHFDYTGVAPEGTEIFVEVYSHNYQLLGVGMVGSDSKMTMKLDPAGMSGFSVDGNEFNREISNFIAEHKTDIAKGNAKAVNKAIGVYGKDNPGSVVSTVLLTSLYDASIDADGAAALFESINETARPAYIVGGYADMIKNAGGKDADRVEAVSILTADKGIARIDPKEYRATIIAFSSDVPTRGDSIKNTLRRLAKRAGGSGLVVDHYLSGDTISWKSQVKRDTVTWTAVWSGAGPKAPGADRFGITSLPYFVVADSTGRTIYRGTSLSTADSLFRKELKK